MKKTQKAVQLYVKAILVLLQCFPYIIKMT